MIKSVLGGKSKNLCDVAYLLTLPVDKRFQKSGYWRVLINAEPNTTYIFSRENANQIIDLDNTYLAISAYDDILHNNWLNHHKLPSLCNKSATLTTGSDGKLYILFNKNIYNNYWQKNLNPFGYIQLEIGSTATEYVPHELTSYKSIMKVSDGRFVTSFDERMPCKTKNLFDKSKADVISREYYFTPNQGAGSNFYVMTVKPGITYTVTYERFIKSSDVGAYNGLELSIQTGTHYTDGTQLLFMLGDDERGVWVKRSKQFNVPSGINQVTFSGLKDRFLYRNFMVQEGITATDYVPYGYV